jgi:hypothetical protein
MAYTKIENLNPDYMFNDIIVIIFCYNKDLQISFSKLFYLYWKFTKLMLQEMIKWAVVCSKKYGNSVTLYMRVHHTDTHLVFIRCN